MFGLFFFLLTQVACLHLMPFKVKWFCQKCRPCHLTLSINRDYIRGYSQTTLTTHLPLVDICEGIPLKFSFSEKDTKIWKNIPLVLTVLSKNKCFVKTGERFFKFFGLLIMSELYCYKHKSEYHWHFQDYLPRLINVVCERSLTGLGSYL